MIQRGIYSCKYGEVKYAFINDLIIFDEYVSSLNKDEAKIIRLMLKDEEFLKRTGIDDIKEQLIKRIKKINGR